MLLLTMNPITFQATISGLSVRNLASLDKGIKFSAEVVEEDDIKMKVAQYLLYQPTDQVFNVTLTPIDQ